MLNFLISNWWIVIFFVAALIIAIGFVYNFISMSYEERNKKIKEWLLYAVTIAEKELGSGTGQIKLRFVYNMFLDKFKFLSKIITFTKFSKLVDEALEKFREMIENNDNLKSYVEEKKGE